MARASVPTLLSLDRFAQIVGIHPLLMNQVTIPTIPDLGGCENSPFLQYSWQGADRVGREEIASAIAAAEDKVAEFLHFKTAPTWETDDHLDSLRPHDPVLYAAGGRTAVRGVLPRLRTSWGYLHRMGTKKLDYIDLASVTYTDVDGDGYKEYASVALPITPGVIVDPSEIAVFHVGYSGDPAYEIRPIKGATIDMTNYNINPMNTVYLTFVAERSQLVKDELLYPMTPQPIDGMVDANFVTEVEIYRRWTDPSAQASLIWFDPACQDVVAQHESQTGAVSIRDNRLGLVTVEAATWDATDEEYNRLCLEYGRAPDQLRLNYYAGWNLNSVWERVITYLALTVLDRPLCACQPLQAFTNHWCTDLARQSASNGVAVSYKMAGRLLGNPIGTRRGEVNAWEHILRYANPEG